MLVVVTTCSRLNKIQLQESVPVLLIEGSLCEINVSFVTCHCKHLRQRARNYTVPDVSLLHVASPDTGIVLCGSCLDCTSKGEEGVKVIDPTQPTSSFISTPPFAFHHPSTRSSRHESIYRILEYPPDWYTYMYSYPAFVLSLAYSVHCIVHICMLAICSV